MGDSKKWWKYTGNVVQVRRRTVSKSSSCLICKDYVSSQVLKVFSASWFYRGKHVGWICGDRVLRLSSFPPEAGMCYTHPVISACSGPLVEEDCSLPACLKQLSMSLGVLPWKHSGLLKHPKSNTCVPDRSSQLEMKNALDPRAHLHAKVGYSSQQTHLSLLRFLISLQDACQRLLSSIQRRIYTRDIPKQHQGTECFFSSLSCYFLTLNNSLTLIVLASGKEAWQIWKPFLLLVRWVYLPSILSQVLWTSYSSVSNKGPIHTRATKRVCSMVHNWLRVRAFRLPLCLLQWHPRSFIIKECA